MGFKFRKNVKIAPGVKLNVNKKSVGVSVGTKGAHYTVNSKGKRTSTVGIPGSGLSYSSSKGGKSKYNGGSSFGCAGLLVLFVPFIFIMAGLQYLREHPAVGITVAVVAALAIIIAVIFIIKKKKNNSAEDISNDTETVNTSSDSENKIHACLVGCYSEEKQSILRRIYRNKHSEDFKIELSFEPVIENGKDCIKVMVNDEFVGFIDENNTPKTSSILNKMESCFFDVRSRTDEGEKLYDATIHISFNN